MSINVQTCYKFTGDLSLDKKAMKAVGRDCDYSGAGFGERDLGWEVKSKAEAKKFKLALESIGLKAEIVNYSG